MEDDRYQSEECTHEMQLQFGEDCEKNTGLKCGSPAFYALAVLLSYLKETQKKGVERLKTVHNYAEAQYMQLSPVTRANLELTETMRGREKMCIRDSRRTVQNCILLRLLGSAASGQQCLYGCLLYTSRCV